MADIVDKSKNSKESARSTAMPKSGDGTSRQTKPRQTPSDPANANLPLFGIGGLLVAGAMVFSLPLDKPTQVVVVAAILSLSVAAIATAISGIINLNTGLLRVSGPFVVFVIVFWTFIAAGAPGLLPDLGLLLGRPRSAP
jgi:hypothetical protein